MMSSSVKASKVIYNQFKMGLGKFLQEIGVNIDVVGSKITSNIAFLEEYTRHNTINPYGSIVPQISKTAVITSNSTLIGEIYISQNVSVGFNSIIRGELNPVRIGIYTHIGDGTTIHTIKSLPTGVPSSVNIGKNVIIGPKCVLYPCIIDDDVKLGPKVVVMDGARLERGCMVEGSGCVPPGRLIPAYTVWGGNPLVFIRQMTEDEKKQNYEESYAHWNIYSKLQEEIKVYNDNSAFEAIEEIKK